MTYLEADPASSDSSFQRPYVDAPPVTCASDLIDRWQTILDGEFFDQRSVWLIWFDEAGRQLPVVVPVDGLPDELDEQCLSGLRSICGVTKDNGARTVAMALSRRGTAQITTVDRQHARTMLAMVRSTGLKPWPVYLATTESIREIMPADVT